MDLLKSENENLSIKETRSAENMTDTAAATAFPAATVASDMFAAAIPSENVMRRDHESIDDFEHLERELSPIKETATEPLIPVTAKSADINVNPVVSTKQSQNLLDIEFEETASVSQIKDAAKKEVDFLEHELIPEKHENMGTLLDISPGLHKAVTEPAFPSHLVDSGDDNFGEKSSPYDMSDKIQFESGIDLSDFMDDKKSLVHDESVLQKEHIPKAKEELEAVYRTEPKHSMQREDEPAIKEKLSEDESTFVMAEKEEHVEASMTPEPDTEEEEPPVPLPKDYDETPVHHEVKGTPSTQLIEDDDIPEIAACDLSGFCAWFNPDKLPPVVGQLVYWRDPKKSGVVFGTLMVVLLSLTVVSLISVVAYLSLAILFCTIIFRVYKSVLQAVQKTEDGHPFKDMLEADLTLTQDKVQEVTELVVSHVNGAVSELRRLFLVEDLVDSIKFGVLLWCLTYLGAWFNGLTLIILGVVGAFTLPKVYENNKAQIDQYLDLVRSKMADVSSKIKAAIPLGKKDKEQ